MAPPTAGGTSSKRNSGGSGAGAAPTTWVQELIIGVLKVLAFGYDILAFLPYQLVYKPYHARMMSESIKARPTVDGDPSSPYRCVEGMNKLATTLDDSCSTLDEVFEKSVSRHAKRKCVGWREIYSEEDEQQKNGRVFKKLMLGDYHWLNFIEVNDMAEQLGAGLQTIGQSPRRNMVIFADTCYQWMVTVQAAFKYTFPAVTVYSTLGEEGIVHSMNESEATHVVTTAALLTKLQGILSSLPHITHIVYIEPQQYSGGVGAASKSSKRPPNVIDAGSRQVKVSSMTDVIKAGEQILSSDKHKLKQRPAPDDIAVIMYTSGSTGVPKGVMISHRNLMAGMAGQCARIPHLGPADTYIGYLPLAHVLELSAELSCLANGTKIGYSSALTLTDNASKVKRGCAGDATVLEPTLMAAVPVIMDRIYKTVWEKVNEGNAFMKALFRWAYERKKRCIEAGVDTPFLNRVIFAKIRAILGGNIRLMLSGGAPLADDTQRFMNICFCCPVGQGYGLTETCGAGTITEVSDLSTGRVGAPLPCCEMKLIDWVEGNYSTSDKPYPRGEIIIRGDNVTMGYYKNEEKTGEDFRQQNGSRWFYTGDIGQFEQDGCLRIIDRKKDLVKLQTGEYISLGRVESLMKTCPVIDEVCLYGESDKMFMVALVVPNSKQLRSVAAKLGKCSADGKSDEQDINAQIVSDVDVTKEVLKMVQEHGKKVKLEKLEIPQKITLCGDQWTAETGLVTEALKLKRKAITERYWDDIRSMYSS